jgi:hypothetical protein
LGAVTSEELNAAAGAAVAAAAAESGRHMKVNMLAFLAGCIFMQLQMVRQGIPAVALSVASCSFICPQAIHQSPDIASNSQ